MIFWIIGFWFSLYYIFWWYDVVAHFTGGIWLASTALILKNKFGLSVSGRFARLAAFLAVMGVLALAGALWEFLEFGADRYVFHFGFTYWPGIYEDTLSDLFIDLAGGLIGFFVYRKHA